MRFSTLYTYLLLSLLILPGAAHAQLTVTPTMPALTLATRLAGAGITVSSPTLTCAGLANGTFKSASTLLTIDSGIILTTGRATSAIGTAATLASFNNGFAGDAALTTLAGATTFDACILQFDFIPKGDTVSFNYQFGSEEYTNSTCGPYNDVFAFYITGPGIVGTQNMALVPGTNIPVTINSINSGTPGPAGAPYFCNISNCTSMGPGSPFTTYYVDNAAGTQLTYRGFTKKLRAYHSVTPCSTYHLKIAIADAGNGLYDSGVFIEAGSLKTNTFAFDHTVLPGSTIAGIPNAIVKGCTPATIKITSARPVTTPQKVYFSYGGTGVKGTDFSGPDSLTFATGDSVVYATVPGIPTVPGGVKSVVMYIQSAYSCGNADTITFNIIDTPFATILTPDTTICFGHSFQIRVSGTPGLDYSWSPATWLSSSTAMQPIASPTTTTTYTMTATLPGSGCPSIVENITVSIMNGTVSILNNDTTICYGATVDLFALGASTATFIWSPITGLSSPTITNPVATPTVTTTYTITSVLPGGGCPATDTVRITVLNPAVNILTPDTSLCPGASVSIRVAGASSNTYSWTPASTLDNPALMQPTATPTGSTKYQITSTIPGTPCTATDEVYVYVFPAMNASAGSDKSVCISNSILLNASPEGKNYTYAWSGPAGFTSADGSTAVMNAQSVNEGAYSVIVTDNNTGCTEQDDVYIAVNNSSIKLTNVTPDQTIPHGSSIQLNANSALYYYWTPNNGTISDQNINNPVATPTEKTIYTVYGIDINGCRDTATVTIDVEYNDNEFIPTAFSPNGDGKNDIFHVVGITHQRMVDFRIFNRWGQQIFQTADPKKGWDGTMNGAPQDMGVYYYIITIYKPEGEQKVMKGEVTLVR